MPTNRIPKEITERSQWLLWRYAARDGRSTKVPFTCQGYRASVTNPDHWSTFEFALKVASRPGFCDGLGFVFTADDDFCGIDLDHVWQSDSDEGASWGWEILEQFSDTYLEESPSGRGVKIWCRAKASECGAWKIGNGQVEIYDHSRYFCVTGRCGPSRTITDHQADVDSLIEYLGPKTSSVTPAIGEKIPYGTQHHTLVSLAGSMWHRGMTSEAIEAALQITNAQQCERPGTPEDISGIVRRIARYPR